jgi:hypothetical protein
MWHHCGEFPREEQDHILRILLLFVEVYLVLVIGASAKPAKFGLPWGSAPASINSEISKLQRRRQHDGASTYLTDCTMGYFEPPVWVPKLIGEPYRGLLIYWQS